jgi:hypothetical protein
LTTPDGSIGEIAAAQHGVVTVAQLHAAGLGPNAIAHRVAKGTLHRVARGVYAVGHRGVSREGRQLAAVFAAGPGAALSRLAAAQLCELWRYPVAFIDVVAPRWRQATPPVRFHRARDLHLRDVTTYLGIPVTTVARTLVDLTDELTKWELANLIHEAAYRARFSLPATRDAIARANGRHNVHKLADALDMHLGGGAGVKSRGELRFLKEVERLGLPEPQVNVELNGFEVDFHWPDLMLAVELDGPGHGRARTRHEDARKERAWGSAGYELLRVRDREFTSALRAVRRRR